MNPQRYDDLLKVEAAGELPPQMQADLDLIRNAGAAPDLAPWPADHPHIVAAESKYGLPKGALSALAMVESSGDPDAVSPTAVTGLFQVTKRTGKPYGLTAANRTNPYLNTDIAARHFKDLLDATGSVEGALARYKGPEITDAEYIGRFNKFYQQYGGTVGAMPGAPTAPPARSLRRRDTMTTSTPTTVNWGGTTPTTTSDPIAVGQSRFRRTVDATVRGAEAVGKYLPGRPIPRDAKLGDALDALGIAAPLNLPYDLTVGTFVETLTGSPFAGDVGTLIATLGMAGLGKLARFAKPRTEAGRMAGAAAQRGAEEIGSAAQLQGQAASRAMTELGQAGQLARAEELGPRVIGAAGRQAEVLTKGAQEAQATARQAVSSVARQSIRALDNAPAATMDDITGRLLPPRVDNRFASIARVGVDDLPDDVRALQQTANRASRYADDFGNTTKELRELGSTDPIAAVQRVAQSPDLARTLLRGATDDEARWIAEAVQVGQTPRTLTPLAADTTLRPLSALPPSGLLGKLAKVSRFVAMGGGYLSGGIGGAVAGYTIERTVEATTRRILNAALNSPAMNRAVTALRTMDPGSKTFATQAARIGELLTRTPEDEAPTAPPPQRPPRTLRRAS